MLRLLVPAMLLVAVASLLASPSAGAKEKDDVKKPIAKKEDVKKAVDPIKWETAALLKRFEAEFDLKAKWSTVNGFQINEEDVKGKHVRILFTFTKDVDAKEWVARGLPFNWGTADEGPYLEFFYFDDENVRILAQRHTSVIVDGDITRKKGEAFRVFVPLADDGILSRTKRVEVHLHTLKKKGAKGTE